MNVETIECHACARDCRLEVFLRGTASFDQALKRRPDLFKCPAGRTPKWTLTGREVAASIPSPTPLRPTSLAGGPSLFGCFQCTGSPCLLEIRAEGGGIGGPLRSNWCPVDQSSAKWNQIG